MPISLILVPLGGFFFVAHLVPMPGRAIGTRMALGFLARGPFRDPPFDNCLARWDHLTVPNIGNSISDLQISTLGTTIGLQNLPFRAGFPQETFWVIDYSSILIHR